MEQKQKFISFRVTPELAAIAKERAKSQHRNVAGYMLNLIEQDCRGIMQETTESIEPPKIVNPVKYQKRAKAGKKQTA